MTDAARFNIANQRNEDFGPFEGRFEDADGEPTDFTGWRFELRIDEELGPAAPLLVIGETKTPGGSYCRILDGGIDGRIEVFIGKADIAALPGDPIDEARFYFNLLSVEADGTRRNFARGCFIAELGLGMFDVTVGLLVTEGGAYIVTEDDDILRF